MDEARRLDELVACLASDPSIDELGIVHPSELEMLWSEDSSGFQDVDRSVFWCSNHKLALALSALPGLLAAARAAFARANSQLEEGGRNAEALLSCSKALLVLQPDHFTAWNARKKLLLTDTREEDLLAELRLATLVLSARPKSEDAWAHRRWVLNRLLHSQNADTLLRQESNFVEQNAERYTMNYRAWHHRCWLIHRMSLSLVREELQRSGSWVLKHVSDNSGFHYRRALISRLLDLSPESATEVLKDELEATSRLIRSSIGREALWIHRRFLALLGRKFAPQDWQKFRTRETEFLEDCMSKSLENVHPEHAAQQKEHCCSYALWLLFLDDDSSSDELYLSCLVSGLSHRRELVESVQSRRGRKTR